MGELARARQEEEEEGQGRQQRQVGDKMNGIVEEPLKIL